MKARIVILLMCCVLLMNGCKMETKASASAAETPAQPVTDVVSTISADGGEVKMPVPSPSGSPTPQSSLTFEKESEAVSYQFISDGQLQVDGGLLTIQVSGQAFKCEITVSEGASVRLQLSNAAAFTGTIRGKDAQCEFVIMDAASTWTLTEDTTVCSVVNEDMTFQNIQSQGCSLTYNASSEDSAYLQNASYALPGGGYLTPII